MAAVCDECADLAVLERKELHVRLKAVGLTQLGLRQKAANILSELRIALSPPYELELLCPPDIDVADMPQVRS